MAVEFTPLNANSINNIDTNFQRVGIALRDAISRSGNNPNEMNADLDMNSNDILNVGEIDADSILIQGLPIGQFNGTYKGLWNSSTSYFVNDIVRDDTGNLWIAKRNNNNAAPVEGDNWTLFMPVPDGVVDGDKKDIIVSNGGAIWRKTREYSTVANLLADDGTGDIGMGYTGSGAKVIVSTGDIITAQGFRYQVADSAASNHHIVTAGGVKLYALAHKGEVSLIQFGATGTGDESAIVQKAFDSSAMIINGEGITCQVNTSVILPANKTAKINLLAGTAGMNILRVNSGNKIFGTITGTGTTNIIERGIYPAVDSVVDVELNIIVKNITVGVQGETVSGGVNQATSPARWWGKIHCENIVGAIGASEGYGVLGTFKSCQFNITGKNIRRHLLYLAAGAIDNVCFVDGDGCGNYLFQINTFSGQPASQRNTVFIKSRNLTEDVAGQSGPVAIVGQSHRNIVTVDCVGNGNDNYAVLIQGTSGGPYPTNNKIINSAIQGTFKGSSVIRLENTDGTIVSNNSIDASATSEVIGIRYSGTLSCWSGGSVVNNSINAQGANNVGIYCEITQASTYIGPNRILNNGTSLRVNDQTGGKRQGFSREVRFTGTSPSITANNSQDTTITLSEPIQTTGSYTSVVMTGMSASYFENAWVGFLARPSETSVTIRAFNGGAGSKTISFAGTVSGD